MCAKNEAMYIGLKFFECGKVGGHAVDAVLSERPFRIYCDGAVLSERPGVILARRARSCALKAAPVAQMVACCGEKVQFPDAKKCTFRRKGVILPTAIGSGKVHTIQRFIFDKGSARGMV